MKTENEELEITTPGEEETPGEEQKSDSVADMLTSKNLDKKIEDIVEQKIELAREAQDNEEEPQDEDEEKPKGLGLLPALLIGGVVVVGIASVLLKNRPNSHPTEAQTENQG